MTTLGVSYDAVDKPATGGDPAVAGRRLHAKGPYPDGFFRDLFMEKQEANRAAERAGHPMGALDWGPNVSEPPGIAESGGMDGVRERLATMRQIAGRVERRDVSSAAGSGGQFLPSAGTLPTVLSSIFATSARAASVMTTVLPTVALPDTGLVVSVPRLTSPADTAVHSEGTAAPESTPSTSLFTTNVAPVSGYVDVSREAIERSMPGLDRALAAELGNAFGESVDTQILNGTGTAPETQGLLASASTAVTDSNTSPTAAAVWRSVSQALGDGASAYGRPLTTVLMHPRRRAWFGAAIPNDWSPRNVEIEQVPAMPTTLNTDQDAIIALEPDAAPVAVTAPRMFTFESVGSDTLTVRLQVFGYVAMLGGRQPTSHAKVTGSALTPPDYTTA